jgi:hypothetical protein
MTIETIMETVDLATSPANMTPAQVLAFLEQLSTEIGVRIDGIKDDLRNAELEEPLTQ